MRLGNSKSILANGLQNEQQVFTLEALVHFSEEIRS
jgi:hypothetical protein